MVGPDKPVFLVQLFHASLVHVTHLQLWVLLLDVSNHLHQEYRVALGRVLWVCISRPGHCFPVCSTLYRLLNLSGIKQEVVKFYGVYNIPTLGTEESVPNSEVS